MAQEKGKTGNPNGRPKGAPNRITTEMRTWIQQLINSSRSQLEQDLNILEPKDRWQIVERLMNYCIPKQSAVDADIKLNTLTDEQLDHVINKLLNQINNE
jgi:uncharacterized protein (UPF0305 family)